MRGKAKVGAYERRSEKGTRRKRAPGLDSVDYKPRPHRSRKPNLFRQHDVKHYGRPMRCPVCVMVWPGERCGRCGTRTVELTGLPRAGPT